MQEVATALPHRPLRQADIELLRTYNRVETVSPVGDPSAGDVVGLAVTVSREPTVYAVALVDGDWEIVDTIQVGTCSGPPDADDPAVATARDRLTRLVTA